MSKSLSTRVHEDKLLWDLVKLIGDGAFRFHELASRMKPLIEQCGAKKVSAAMFELLQHVGWITQLNPAARKAAWGVLGPPAEKWDEYYTDPLGRPQPRPDHHKEPPAIPSPEPDPILDGLTRKTATELDITLRQSRAVLRKPDSPEHQRQLAEETIPRVESELVRRGEAIPPPEPEEKEVLKAEEKPEEAPKTKRTRKKKAETAKE